MSIKISQRGDVQPFVVMDMLAAANALEAQGRDIIHMDAGQPSARAPKPAVAAARKMLDTGAIGYTEALGMPPLRSGIAAHYRSVYDLDIPDSRIVVTTGSSGGFLLAFLALFDEGDRIVLPSPGYPAYRNALKSVNLEPVILETDASTRWMPSLAQIDRLAQDGPIDGLLIASPNNPTGTVIEAEALKELAEGCTARGIQLISDEIYHGLTYGARAHSALEFSGDAVVVNSFSKYFVMTGWRIGWMVVPEALVRTVERLAQNHFISAPALSQVAARAAFDARDELEAIKSEYAASRAMLLERLPQAGLDRIVPADGAFYLYADVTRFSNSSHEFALKLLNETGVATTPGIDFDEARGQGFLRFCFAGRPERMVEAAGRIADWLK